MAEAIRQSLDAALAVSRESLFGSMIIVVVAALGWFLAADCERIPVRVVGWWIDHVVRPLLRLRTWAARAATVAVNNSVACGLMVLLGAVPLLGWAGVACIGLTLGIAIRLMTTVAMPTAPDHGPAVSLGEAPGDGTTASGDGTRVAITVGLALNALELPAIMLSSGLALGQMSEAVSFASAARTFGVLVVPALIVAAAGESLWMGARGGLGRGPGG